MQERQRVASARTALASDQAGAAVDDNVVHDLDGEARGRGGVAGRQPARGVLGLVRGDALVAAAQKARPARVLAPVAGHAPHGEAPDVELALRRDVHAQEALVVGKAHAGEALVKVHVEPAHGDVEVAAKDGGDGGRGEHPVVGQHAGVVAEVLQAGEAAPAGGAHGDASQRNGLRDVKHRHEAAQAVGVRVQAVARQLVPQAVGVREVLRLEGAVPVEQAVVALAAEHAVLHARLDREVQAQHQADGDAEVRRAVHRCHRQPGAQPAGADAVRLGVARAAGGRAVAVAPRAAADAAGLGEGESGQEEADGGSQGDVRLEQDALHRLGKHGAERGERPREGVRLQERGHAAAAGHAAGDEQEVPQAADDVKLHVLSAEEVNVAAAEAARLRRRGEGGLAGIFGSSGRGGAGHGCGQLPHWRRHHREQPLPAGRHRQGVAARG
mmetsp:Transcript_23146/g.60224  ORF Transcript_23146/g.60224 Transcript_23146/m.60224 type:complete len:442 (+) Transcript_23146:81-1406(+)